MSLLRRIARVATATFLALVVFHFLLDDDVSYSLEDMLHEHDDDPTTFLQ